MPTSRPVAGTAPPLPCGGFTRLQRLCCRHCGQVIIRVTISSAGGSARGGEEWLKHIVPCTRVLRTRYRAGLYYRFRRRARRDRFLRPTTELAAVRHRTGSCRANQPGRCESRRYRRNGQTLPDMAETNAAAGQTCTSARSSSSSHREWPACLSSIRPWLDDRRAVGAGKGRPNAVERTAHASEDTAVARQGGQTIMPVYTVINANPILMLILRGKCLMVRMFPWKD